MVAPEIAAALHNTLFDMRNNGIHLGSNQQHQGPDLKSFGYLRSLYEAKLTSGQILAMINHQSNNSFSLFGKNNQNDNQTTNNVYQIQNNNNFDGFGGYQGVQNITTTLETCPSDADADSHARTTLHYRPAQHSEESIALPAACMGDNTGPPSDCSDSDYGIGSSPEHDFTPCDATCWSPDLFRCSDDSVYEDGVGFYSSGENVTIESIEDNIPDILKEDQYL